MRRYHLYSLLISFFISNILFAQYAVDLQVVQKIKAEGFKNSQVMEIASYLTDVHGPRLSGTPALMNANKWTLEKLTEWGLENGEIEPWGVFGRGWTVDKINLEMIEPQYMPMIAYPKAWVAGTDGIVSGSPILLNIKKEEDLEEYKGKLLGAIVMLGGERDTDPNFDADASRYTDKELEKIAMASEPGARSSWRDRIEEYRTRRKLQNKIMDFLKEEKVAAVLEVSRGEDGTIFVGSGGSYKIGEEPGLPSVVVSAEQYNRIVRILEKEVPVKLELNLKTTFYEDDSLAYNVIAEISGTDLADEVVMLGGHIDSWHAGTGATDDASGVAVAMEAVRIIKTLNLKPRRTIRIALWSAEEQGLFGSMGYVKKHFGDSNTMELKEDHENISVYFNYDNGTGKIRGIYLQENDAARPIFEAWLKPFNDLGASTVSIKNTGGTDHLSFNAVGIPGFQFIQDELDYSTRTHHTNMDVYDKLVKSDLMQSAVIMASFVYNASMMDEKFPRKELPKPSTRPHY